jgi:hypothetical protein
MKFGNWIISSVTMVSTILGSSGQSDSPRTFGLPFELSPPSVFAIAVNTKDLPRVIRVLKSFPETIISYYFQFEALRLAIHENDLEAFRFLMKKDISTFSRQGADLLGCAIAEGRIEIAREILDNAVIPGNPLSIVEAVNSGNTEMLDLLLCDSRYNQPLYVALNSAVTNSDSKILEHILTRYMPPINRQRAELLILGSVDKDLDENFRVLSSLAQGNGVRKAINSAIIAYCVEKRAWKILGALMAVQFTRWFKETTPSLFFGLDFLLKFSEEGMAVQRKALDDYLDSFETSYARLPDDMKCKDWLMDLFKGSASYNIPSTLVIEAYKATVSLPADASVEELQQATLKTLHGESHNKTEIS